MTNTEPENPFAAGEAPGVAPRRTHGPWLLPSGIACLALSAICLLVTIAGISRALTNMNTSSPTENAQQIAAGFEIVSIPAAATLPLFAAGLVLTGWALWNKRHRTRASHQEKATP